MPEPIPENRHVIGPRPGQVHQFRVPGQPVRVPPAPLAPWPPWPVPEAPAQAQQPIQAGREAEVVQVPLPNRSRLDGFITLAVCIVLQGLAFGLIWWLLTRQTDFLPALLVCWLPFGSLAGLFTWLTWGAYEEPRSFWLFGLLSGFILGLLLVAAILVQGGWQAVRDPFEFGEVSCMGLLIAPGMMLIGGLAGILLTILSALLKRVDTLLFNLIAGLFPGIIAGLLRGPTSGVVSGITISLIAALLHRVRVVTEQ
jgi:hypothetical protein